ncbi:SRPBCC family protein [Methylocella tundrae]|uniref:Putative Polyketide cyclase / dehydrase and lipid transport n=1 Tax=Methylocella tundrae TaxID=227605 RepID=A0A4V6IN67_METTU|nr:SRPBCC family protein [Methylocella tundrae]WPP04504.1 SRPBCC family protein [Methylocella tundrae]VFU10904.1 putative Polyketide cyclase / dehydrase and lipid transport [Methylocella tundrae]
MPGFSAQIEIKAPAAEVFAFVSDINDMPRYLPTVEKANWSGEDRVHLEGAANGRPYAVDGRLHIDADAMQMSWGSLERESYHGELQVFETDEGSELACRIEFQPHLQTMENLAGAAVPDADFIKAKLDAVLRAAKQAVESQRKAAAGEGELEPANKGDYKLVF